MGCWISNPGLLRARQTSYLLISALCPFTVFWLVTPSGLLPVLWLRVTYKGTQRTDHTGAGKLPYTQLLLDFIPTMPPPPAPFECGSLSPHPKKKDLPCMLRNMTRVSHMQDKWLNLCTICLPPQISLCFVAIPGSVRDSSCLPRSDLSAAWDHIHTWN